MSVKMTRGPAPCGPGVEWSNGFRGGIRHKFKTPQAWHICRAYGAWNSRGLAVDWQTGVGAVINPRS